MHAQFEQPHDQKDEARSAATLLPPGPRHRKRNTTGPHQDRSQPGRHWNQSPERKDLPPSGQLHLETLAAFRPKLWDAKIKVYAGGKVTDANHVTKLAEYNGRE